jgi:ATP-binding cassette subfamily B protein
MGGFGPPAGSPFAGPGGGQNLPFAGMPPELAERAEAVLDTEPEHPAPEIDFEQHEKDRRPFTLRRFVGPHKWALLVAAILVIVETLMVTAGPFLIGEGIDRGVLASDEGALFAIAMIYVGTVILGSIASGLRVSFTGRLGEKLMYELRIRVFSHLQRLSLDFFTGEKAGRLMTRMTSDIDALTALFQEGLVNMFVQALTLVIITGVMFAVNPTLAAILILGSVPIMLGLTLWFRGASDRGYTVVRDRIADVLADLQENIAGVRVIATHNRRRHNVVHHTNVVGDYRSANNYTAKIGAIYSPATEFVGYIAQGLLLVVGGWMVSDGQLTLGELTSFFLYLTMFFAPIQQLVQLYNTYQQGQAAIAKLRDLFATTPSVEEAADAVELPPMDGEIELEHVTFGYSADTPILTDVSLTIAEGETFALVGETGAGKSTIAKLVTRFYDPQAGTVRIDGHDLKDVTFKSLRGQIGVVPQEPFLFGGTVRDNITFARPDADDEEVWEACVATGIDDLVERQGNGLDSVIHERGASLSSGERQLLALARAFLARPRVLVLDEATSNLDLRSETKIERALDRLLEGRTAIIIAHRLATAMRADRIAVVHDGAIVELGSHDELVALGGRYAAMYDTWNAHTAGEPAS